MSRRLADLELYAQQMRALRKAELEDARFWRARAKRSEVLGDSPYVIAYRRGRSKGHVLKARQFNRQLLEAHKQIEQILADTTVTGLHRVLMPPPGRKSG